MRDRFWFYLNVICVFLLVKDYVDEANAQQCSCQEACSLPERDDVGRGTWKLLHSIVENVDNTDTNEKLFKHFVLSLQYLYPCEICKKHIGEMDLKLKEIHMTKKWMCDFHNRVNKKLEKPIFNCENY